MRRGTTFALALLCGAGLVQGCIEEDAVSEQIGGEPGTTEAPRRVSAKEAQEIAEAIEVAGGERIDKALPESTSDPATPAVRELKSNDVGVSSSRLEIPFRAESREGGGELRGAYLQLEGADFYWDVPERSLKQNAVTATDDVALALDLPELAPGIEFCFTVCVYSSEQLISLPETTCITVPNLEPSLSEGIATICRGIDACGLDLGGDCEAELTRDVAEVQAFGGCSEAVVSDAIECVSARADDCEFLTAAFGDLEDDVGTGTTTEGAGGAADGGTFDEDPVRDEPEDGGTTFVEEADGGTTATDSGGSAPAADSGGSLSAVFKQNQLACQAEIDALSACEGGDDSAPAPGTNLDQADGGEDIVREDAGSGPGDFGEADGGTVTAQDPCESEAVLAFEDVYAAQQQVVATAETTACASTCSIETGPAGYCYIVSDNASFSDVEAAIVQTRNALLNLTIEEQICVANVEPPPDYCDSSVSCDQGSCTVL